MRPDTCLKRRLLHASVQAYHPDPPVYSASPGWADDPARISPGPSSIPFLNLPRPEFDFALVGRLPDGIAVAFRGTLPPLDLSPRGQIVNPVIRGAPIRSDWWNNLDARPAREVRIDGTILPGTVHSGFAASLARLWTGIAAEIGRMRAQGAPPRLYFTGHSKGGALANLAAVCASQVWSDVTVKAATFGAPRAGDGEFASAYRAAGIDCHRYEVAGDPVPHVPSSTAAVGTLHALDAVAHPGPSPFAFLRELFTERDDRWLLPEPVAAHLPYPKFGYGDHVCEEGCRHDWR